LQYYSDTDILIIMFNIIIFLSITIFLQYDISYKSLSHFYLLKWYKQKVILHFVPVMQSVNKIQQAVFTVAFYAVSLGIRRHRIEIHFPFLPYCISLSDTVHCSEKQ